MNKRQAKKREALIRLGMHWEFDKNPTYREIKKIKRRYHNHCVNLNKKSDLEIIKIFD